jgi:hypothetical protein
MIPSEYFAVGLRGGKRLRTADVEREELLENNSDNVCGAVAGEKVGDVEGRLEPVDEVLREAIAALKGGVIRQQLDDDPVLVVRRRRRCR